MLHMFFHGVRLYINAYRLYFEQEIERIRNQMSDTIKNLESEVMQQQKTNHELSTSYQQKLDHASQLCEQKGSYEIVMYRNVTTFSGRFEL